MKLPVFTILGRCRTKKNSGRIVRTKTGKPTILPSAAHAEWFKCAMQQSADIRRTVEHAGLVTLPITGPVNVAAKFYRDRNVGDANGFYQALGDFLQSTAFNKKTGKTIRTGAGILVDDKQIASWNGSVLLKDAAHPRIEVEITVL